MKTLTMENLSCVVTLLALLTLSGPAGAVQYFIYPGTDLSTINWSIGKAGDELVIMSGTYNTQLRINSVRLGPITVRPQDPKNPPVLTAGMTIFDSSDIIVQDLVLKREIHIRNSSFLTITRNSIEVVGYSGNPGGSYQWAALIVTHGSSYVYLMHNVVKNAFVGISIGGDPTTDLPNKHGIQLINNTVSNIFYHGVVVANIVLTPSSAADTIPIVQLHYNRIFDNGGHGIEFMARFGKIENNVLRNNGFRLPGTSGIHIFSHGKGLDEQCSDNVIQYNFVSEQKDRSGPEVATDGNGIQVDHFCRRNTIQFNVLWLNDGPGVNIFSAPNNTVRSNTVYNNFQHTSRTPWAGRGEIMISSTEAPCPGNASQVCVYVPRRDGSGNDVVPFPFGGASGNKIYDNLVYSTRPENPGLLIGWSMLNPAWGNQRDSKYGPNLYYGSQPVNSLYWNAGCPGFNTFNATSPCWRKTAVSIDSTTATTGNAIELLYFKFPTQVTTGNAIELLYFKFPNLPARPYHGLTLYNQPVARGEPWPAVQDMYGSTMSPCANFFGAYYYSSRGSITEL